MSDNGWTAKTKVVSVKAKAPPPKYFTLALDSKIGIVTEGAREIPLGRLNVPQKYQHTHLLPNDNNGQKRPPNHP